MGYFSISNSIFDSRTATRGGTAEGGSLRSAFPHRVAMRLILSVFALLMAACDSQAQLFEPRHGEIVPRDVREMYDQGLKLLDATQSEEGDWKDGQNGPGVTGLCVMAFMASGEDPNFGPYSDNIRKALRSMVRQQNTDTGYLGSSMYHHGFATLGLAEAYGAVDERNLWPAGEQQGKRSLGEALELAVRCAVTSQKKNPTGAWRYSPDANDADTSVSGAVLVGLLAARNAGIEVPDESINQAIDYYVSMTSDSGQVGYSGLGGFGESTARTSIASLVFAIARRKDLPKYDATLAYLTQNLEQSGNDHYREYTLYYQAQALFQGDIDAWEKWNKLLVRQLKESQQPDGGFKGSYGDSIGTAMSLLALALNYRFLPIYER